MPNLNLKDDGIEEIPTEPMSPLEELGIDESPGVLRKVLPIVAGGVVAVMLIGYILNRTGIIHVWGNKKAPSVMVAVPQESAPQTLSDSAMASQFANDSAQIAAGTSTAPSSGKTPQSAAAAGTNTQSGKKNTAEAAKLTKQEEKKKLADAAAAKIS